MCREATGKLWGVSCLSFLGFRGMGAQVISLGSKHLYLLSHLTGLPWMFLGVLLFVCLLCDNLV